MESHARPLLMEFFVAALVFWYALVGLIVGQAEVRHNAVLNGCSRAPLSALLVPKSSQTAEAKISGLRNSRLLETHVSNST